MKSKMTNVELLGIISFCVLMEGRKGIIGVAPSYMAEKVRLLKSPFAMYNALDDGNSRKVLEWGKKWGIDFDSLIKEMQENYWKIPAPEFREKYSMKELQ